MPISRKLTSDSRYRSAPPESPHRTEHNSLTVYSTTVRCCTMLYRTVLGCTPGITRAVPPSPHPSKVYWFITFLSIHLLTLHINNFIAHVSFYVQSQYCNYHPRTIIFLGSCVLYSVIHSTHRGLIVLLLLEYKGYELRQFYFFNSLDSQQLLSKGEGKGNK